MDPDTPNPYGDPSTNPEPINVQITTDPNLVFNPYAQPDPQIQFNNPYNNNQFQPVIEPTNVYVNPQIQPVDINFQNPYEQPQIITNPPFDPQVQVTIQPNYPIINNPIVHQEVFHQQQQPQ